MASGACQRTPGRCSASSRPSSVRLASSSPTSRVEPPRPVGHRGDVRDRADVRGPVGVHLVQAREVVDRARPRHRERRLQAGEVPPLRGREHREAALGPRHGEVRREAPGPREARAARGSRRRPRAPRTPRPGRRARPARRGSARCRSGCAGCTAGMPPARLARSPRGTRCAGPAGRAAPPGSAARRARRRPMASTKPKKESYTGGDTTTGPPSSVSRRSSSAAPIITSGTIIAAEVSTSHPQASWA